MLIENILSPRECEKIVTEFDNTLQQKDEGFIYNNSFGVYNLPSTLRYKLRFEKIIQKTYPNIEFSNTYTRKYLENSYLKPHIDRNNLDISVSICIENKANLTWPLYVSNVEWSGPWLIKSDYSAWTDSNTPYSYSTGSGIIYQGKKFVHWREKFTGTDDQRIVYIYYHWKIL